MRDEFRQPSTHGRRLLQAAAGEAVAQIEAVRSGRSDDGVVVEKAEIVGAGPGAAGADGLEGRDSMGERRPDALLEEAPVYLLGRRIVVLPIGVVLAGPG